MRNESETPYATAWVRGRMGVARRAARGPGGGEAPPRLAARHAACSLPAQPRPALPLSAFEGPSAAQAACEVHFTTCAWARWRHRA
jgi:hypothetical protein